MLHNTEVHTRYYILSGLLFLLVALILRFYTLRIIAGRTGLTNFKERILCVENSKGIVRSDLHKNTVFYVWLIITMSFPGCWWSAGSCQVLSWLWATWLKLPHLDLESRPREYLGSSSGLPRVNEFKLGFWSWLAFLCQNTSFNCSSLGQLDTDNNCIPSQISACLNAPKPILISCWRCSA